MKDGKPSTVKIGTELQAAFDVDSETVFENDQKFDVMLNGTAELFLDYGTEWTE